MKTQPSRRQHGFTLVELLVVIAIIAVLAGAGFAAGNAAIQKARKTVALASAHAIESAVNNFFTEYGSMPRDNMTTDTTINTKSNADFLNVLLGTEVANIPLNTRSIKFLSVKEGKPAAGGGTNGILYGTDGKAKGLYDPWGGQFNVVLDGDYDETLKSVKPKGAGAQSADLNGRRCAVWSDGADGAKSGSTGKAGDDVKTW